MKENVENLKFSDQCSYALIESFNGLDKSFDPYHIAVLLKSLKDIRAFFQGKAAKLGSENILKLKEESLASDQKNIYENFDQLLGAKAPQPLISCFSKLHSTKKLDSLEQLQRRYYALANKSHGIQIIDEVISSNAWDDSSRSVFKEKLPDILGQSNFKEILIKKKTIKKNILGGLVVRINSLVIDCSTNNLIRIQLRNRMKVN